MSKRRRAFAIILTIFMVLGVFSGGGYRLAAAEAENDDSEGKTEIVDDFNKGRTSNWSWSGGWKYDEKVELEAVSFLDEQVLQ